MTELFGVIWLASWFIRWDSWCESVIIDPMAPIPRPAPLYSESPPECRENIYYKLK